MMMRIASLFALLSTLSMTSAKMRGVNSGDVDKEFLNSVVRPGDRKLMGGMDSGNCPGTGDVPDILCTKNSDCQSWCGDRDGCCCIYYTIPYCGVPGDCNDFQYCLEDDEEAVQLPSSLSTSESIEQQFEFLEEASRCLNSESDGTDLGGGSEDMGGDSEDRPMDSEDMHSGPKKKGNKMMGKSGDGSGSETGKTKGTKKGGKVRIIQHDDKVVSATLLFEENLFCSITRSLPFFFFVLGSQSESGAKKSKLSKGSDASGSRRD